jgi:outer membrane protein assembly factor BamE (lipoprotein component of BamABCDE complex)
MNVLLGLGLSLAMAACAPIYRDHGYVPAAEQLELLTVGLDTKDTVSESLGTPQSTGALRDDAWFYIASTFKHLTYNKPKETSREVVSLSFDAEGVLENVEHFGLEDGQVVALSRRVTTLPIKAPGFLKQVFSDIGRFDLAQGLGQ